MKFRVMPVFYVAFAMIVVWGITGWAIAKTSKPQFDKTIETIAEGRANDFFEVEGEKAYMGASHWRSLYEIDNFILVFGYVFFGF